MSLPLTSFVGVACGPQSVLDDDMRFAVQDPRSVDVADVDAGLAKQVRQLRRQQARQRKEKAEMEARRAAMDAERARLAAEKAERRELRLLAQQRAKEASAAAAVVVEEPVVDEAHLLTVGVWCLWLLGWVVCGGR